MQSITIGANQAGQRLDKFLHKYLPNAGTSFLYKMLRKKNITLNGKKAEGKEMLQLGDTVESFFSEETFLMFSATGNKDETVEENTADYLDAYHSLKGIQILYEDEHILILHKPAGILTQKAEEKDKSLNEWLIGYLLEKKLITPKELLLFHPSICNRLDRNTSGIVLCGCSLFGLQELNKAIKDRKVKKYYETICTGKITEKITLEDRLTKDEKTNRVKIKQAKDSDGSFVCTICNPQISNNEFTLLEVELVTGKTHQIRAQLANYGHPLIGDYKYGDKQANDVLRKRFGLRSHLLHAGRIVFTEMTGVLSNVSGKEFCSPPPVLFQKIVKELELEEKKR